MKKMQNKNNNKNKTIQIEKEEEEVKSKKKYIYAKFQCLHLFWYRCFSSFHIISF